MTFVEFVEGPLWTFSLVVFVVGVAWRIFSMLRLGTKGDLSVSRGAGAPGAATTIVGRFFPRSESMGPAGIQIVAGYMFHLGLFALVLFGAPHVEFIKERLLGFGWTPMPHWAFIVSAEIAFAGLMLLWLRRLLHPVTRLLSSFDDHAGSVLTFVAMFTGCMALLESFAGLRVIHMLSVQLLMVYFPFSNLMHAFTFAFSRGYTGASYARRGVRA